MLYAKTLVDSADNVSLKEWKLTALGSTVGNLDCSAGNSLSKFLVSWHNEVGNGLVRAPEMKCPIARQAAPKLEEWLCKSCG